MKTKCYKVPAGTPLIERLMFHKFRMLERRVRQLALVPDVDARLTYFSKNSLPAYRKN